MRAMASTFSFKFPAKEKASEIRIIHTGYKDMIFIHHTKLVNCSGFRNCLRIDVRPMTAISTMFPRRIARDCRAKVISPAMHIYLTVLLR